MSAIDNRKEPRAPTDLNVQIWGADVDGMNFVQAAVVRNISGRGALLLGIERILRSGDLIRIQYGARSARFRVVWVSPGAIIQQLKIAVQRIDSEACPWEDQIQHAGSSKVTVNSAPD